MYVYCVCVPMCSIENSSVELELRSHLPGFWVQSSVKEDALRVCLPPGLNGGIFSIEVSSSQVTLVYVTLTYTSQHRD